MTPKAFRVTGGRDPHPTREDDTNHESLLAALQDRERYECLREHDELTEAQFRQTRSGAAVWLFSGYWLVALLVLLPLSVILHKRAGVPFKAPLFPAGLVGVLSRSHSRLAV